MKKLVLANNIKIYIGTVSNYADKDVTKDCNKIIAICKKRGFEIDLLTAYNAWFNYSARTHAGQWLWQSPIEQATFEAVLYYCDIKEDEKMKKLILTRWPQVTEIGETDKKYRIHFCERIIEAFKERGFEIDLLTAYSVWGLFSRDNQRLDWWRLPHLNRNDVPLLIAYCNVDGDPSSRETYLPKQPLSTIEKFQKITAACEAGFQLLVNQHLGTRVYENNVQNQCSIDEYVKIMENGGLNPLGTRIYFYHRYEAEAIRKQIIKSNTIYELYLYMNNVEVNYKIVHYDLTLAIDEAWKLLLEFGKVEE